MVTPPPSPKRADGVCAAASPTTTVQHTASKLSIRRCIACPPWRSVALAPLPPRPAPPPPHNDKKSVLSALVSTRDAPQLLVAVGGGSVTTPDNADAVMGSHPRHEVVVADHADRSVGLEHGEQHVLDVRDAVLAQRLHHLVARDPGATQVRLEDIAVVDQHDAFAGE